MYQNLKLILPFTILLVSVHIVQAQVSVNEDGSDPDASAMLDIKSTDKGMLVPRMTTTQRNNINSPATGLLVFDIDENGFYFFDGSNWVSITSTTRVVQDEDNDTKIQVEESANEDVIRFDLGGVEYFRMDSARLEPVNNGKSVFIGEGAGQNDDFSENYNVFVGYKAGLNGTTAHRNVGVGSETMQSLTTGRWNVSLGHRTLHNITNGEDNIAIGVPSLFNLTTGDRNISLGSVSLDNLTTGNRNIAIGFEAGKSTTGSSNIFIGDRAAFNETGSNKLYIENSSSTSPLIYGEFDNDLLRVNGTLNINNAYSFPTTAGTNGQVLVNNGSNALAWGNVGDNLGDHTATTSLDMGTNSVLFNDAQNGNNVIGFISDDALGGKKGIVLKASGAANGNELFSAETVGGGVVFQVKDNGQLNIADGNQGSGKVLTSDANGNTSWKEPSERVAICEDNTVDITNGNTATDWERTSDYSNWLTVESGDLIVISSTFKSRIMGGSGSDALAFRIEADGNNGCSNTNIGTTSWIESYQGCRTCNFSTAVNASFVATCSGTYRFALQTYFGGTDDEVRIDRVHISAVKF